MKATASTGTGLPVAQVSQGGVIVNPPFDKRITSIPGIVGSLKGKGLTRGRIRQANIDHGHHRYGCNFLYNPQSVSAQHAIDTSIVNQKDPNDLSSIIVPLSQSVNFQLLFDRTYETWDSKYNNTPIGKQGVYADILALYNIVGITAKIDEASLGAAGDGGAQALGQRGSEMDTMVVSPMVWTPVWVYFGGPLKYYGAISSLGVTYSHWTQNMIPNRAGVDITLSLLPKPSNTLTQNIDDNADYNARIGISADKPLSMADIRRAGG